MVHRLISDHSKDPRHIQNRLENCVADELEQSSKELTICDMLCLRIVLPIATLISVIFDTALQNKII